MLTSLRNIKMGIQGFRKVALKDSKQVLNESNNFKWVKEKGSKKITILPSGTKVTKTYDNSFLGMNGDSIVIEKANGDVIACHEDSIVKSVTKNGKSIFNQTVGERLLIEQKKEAAKKLAQYTRDEIILHDGRKVKRIFDENKKVVAWSRQGNGENLKVRIKRPLNGVVGTIIHKSHGNDVYSTKVVSNIYPSTETTVYNFKNPQKYTQETVSKALNPKTNKMEIVENKKTEMPFVMGPPFDEKSLNISLTKEIMQSLFK